MSRLPLLIGTLWIVALLGWTETADSGGSPGPNTNSVLKRIEQVRQVAERIQIDGKGEDWKGIPSFNDPGGDADDDASRDLIRVAVAPREKDLLVMFETLGRVSLVDYSFGLDLDFTGSQMTECRINFAFKEPAEFYVHYEKGGSSAKQQLPGIQVVVDEVLEARIPYAVLAKHLPAEMGRKVSGPEARPWMRIYPFSWDFKKKTYPDFGPAVASFRLLPTPYVLDSPPSRPVETVKALELPVDGQWYVCQGPHGNLSHQDAWACDLIQTDRCLQYCKKSSSKRLEDYFCWGKQVFAPIAGRVLYTRSTVADGVNGPDDFAKLKNTQANELALAIGDNLAFRLVHFMKDSIPAKPGQQMSVGQPLGKVGSPGMSTSPHLHLDLYQLPDYRVSVPLAFANVRTSLNPGSQDPWERDFKSWMPREGFFVERLKK